MSRRVYAPLLILVVMGVVWSGCESSSDSIFPNLEPNTRISAGPPEASDTGYVVNLFWFGWDDDGFIDHYEIAWDDTTEWQGPIFANDSLFAVLAAESCCVEPLTDYRPDIADSVYEQFHTFWIRAVDNTGTRDQTPAFRSFNAKTVAPNTRIDSGPRELGSWGTNVEFRWTGRDDDGVAVAFRYALTSLDEWRFDHPGETEAPLTERVAWLDTLQYRPLPGGGYDTTAMWQFTTQSRAFFPELQVTDGTTPPNTYLFAVRAIDDAGAEERILNLGQNTRQFKVTSALDGPKISITSNVAGSWRSSDPSEERQVFAGQGIKFEWRASPGQSEAPVAGYSYAVDDTAAWSPWSLNSQEWPVQDEADEVLWFPNRGPHSFFVRAIDLSGFIRILPAKLKIFPGPRFCQTGRYIFIVQDTSAGSLLANSIVPNDYESVERGLIDYWFEGYCFQVHQTRGLFKPRVDQMDCASSLFWFHTAVIDEGDDSILLTYHTEPPNIIPSYINAGGNFFLCGTQPSRAIAYFEKVDDAAVNPESFPVLFLNTLTDTTLVPHWAATQLGISRINDSVPNTNTDTDGPRRLRIARSSMPQYPDLRFDPLTWPSGPALRGFGYYDLDVIPFDGVADTVYTFNDTGQPIAVRRLTSPGVNGNTMYLGFHPNFVDRPAFKELIQAVLTDFGEFPIPCP